jgi:hypothetical protein
MSLPSMMSMITIAANRDGTHFCVECADDYAAIREKITQALHQGRLDVGDPEKDEVCEGCGRLIKQVPAYGRTYLLHPILRITSTL